MSRRVLVVGGAGSFGSRLVRALVATTDFAVLVGGRSQERAAALAAELAAAHPGHTVETAVIDRDAATPEMLRAHGLFAVVDAAGPFQAAETRLAEAAIAAGVHYVDLADARDFVAAFPRLDDAATRAGVTAVTGASSTPALSNAALDSLTRGWREIDSVEIAISPGNRAPRGHSVVGAILSYAGRPIRVFLDGEWRTRPGWGMLVRRHMPGIGSRLLSLCETPDLDLVQRRLGVTRSAVFRAGLELWPLHLGLWLASLPVRARMIRSLRPFATPFRAAADLFLGFGTDRGGMIVEAKGVAEDGRTVEALWSLVAEAGDGPVIPTLPALATLRRLHQGRLPSGAFACVELLTLADIEAEMQRYRIATRTSVACEGDDLFVRALGDSFSRMPEAIRAAHLPRAHFVLTGAARVDAAESQMGRFVAALFGLPPAAERVPVTVTMEAQGGAEIWTRDFGGRRFRSMLSLEPQGITERFGPFTFGLDVVTSEAGLDMTITGWRMGRLPLPRRFAPFTKASERIDSEGRFKFDVMIGVTPIGRLVRYRGWLEPVDPASA